MKRGVIAIFLLLTTLMFAEDSQIDETRELKERVIKLEAVIERMEREQDSSTNYYKEALNDSKEIYNEAIKNNDNMMTHVYWFVGGAGTLLLALLGFLKIDSDKKLKEEKNEIKKDNERALKDLRTENKSLLDEVKLTQEKIIELDELIKNENRELDKKLKRIKEENEVIEINLQIAQNVSGKTSKNKYIALKKLEEEVKEKLEISKENLYFHLGCSCTEIKRFEEAIEYYNRVLKINPKNKGAYANRGTIYSDVFGNDEKAKQDYEQAILVDEGFKLAHYNLGNFYLYKDKNYEKAFEKYSKVVELDDKYEDFLEVYQQRAQANLGLKDYVKALNDLKVHLRKTGNQKFKIWITKEQLEGFANWMRKEENKTELEIEVLRRFEEKEGIKII